MIELFVGALIGAESRGGRKLIHRTIVSVHSASISPIAMVRGLIRIIGERWNRCCRA